MMKIKRNSWHFRIHYWFYEKDSNLNLCKYFWQYMLMLVFSPFIVFGFVLIYPFIWLTRKFPRLKNILEKDLSNAYLKAKKDKICPSIEIIEPITRHGK